MSKESERESEREIYCLMCFKSVPQSKMINWEDTHIWVCKDPCYTQLCRAHRLLYVLLNEIIRKRENDRK